MLHYKYKDGLKNFNTSHVSINRNVYIYCNMLIIISIHPMFLLIPFAIPYSSWRLNISIHPMFLLIYS